MTIISHRASLSFTSFRPVCPPQDEPRRSRSFGAPLLTVLPLAGADEDETRNDLKSWGYNEQLELVKSSEEKKETVAEPDKEAEKEVIADQKAEEPKAEEVESSYS